VTRRKRAAARIRRAAALKGWATRRKKARSAAALKGWKTRRANTRELSKPAGAPQGGEDFDAYVAPARPSEGYQEGGVYGGYEGQDEPAWVDFDGWDYEDFDGLEAEADDDGDTGGESAKT
jgi:hypothetical protein